MSLVKPAWGAPGMSYPGTRRTSPEGDYVSRKDSKPYVHTFLYKAWAGDRNSLHWPQHFFWWDSARLATSIEVRGIFVDSLRLLSCHTMS
jgi:hypothetical protein